MIRIRLLFLWAKGIIAVAAWTALHTHERSGDTIGTMKTQYMLKNSLKKLCSLSLLPL